MGSHQDTYCVHNSTVKDMWDHLSASFSAKESSSHAYSVVQAYSRVDQGDSTFTDYFTRLSKLRDELRVMFPPTADLKVQEERNNKMDVMMFIVGLPSKYSSARPLLLSNPTTISSVAVTYHLLREMYGPDANFIDTSALYTSASAGKSTPRGQQLTARKGVGRGSTLSVTTIRKLGTRNTIAQIGLLDHSHLLVQRPE